MASENGKGLLDFEFEKPTRRNPVTAARFKRESWWQITFPIIVITILIAVAVALVWVLGGTAGTSVIADYSLILLALPLLVIGLLFLALFIALSVILAKAIRGLPPYSNVGHEGLDKAYQVVDEKTNQVASVVISFRSFVTGVNLFLRAQGILFDEDETTENGSEEKKETEKKSSNGKGS